MAPAAGVNVPTNVKTKQEYVNRKLQLYGIYKAFEAGKVPSNEQIDTTLNSFLASRPLSKPSERLSADGKTLVADFREVVQQAKLLLLTKNEGELLQDFIWQCQKIDGGNAAVPGAPVNQETAQQHAQHAKEGFRTLGQLIITNGEFRKLLSDAVVLLRDIAGDAATNVANRVNPSDDELSQIDRPAAENTWHETPDMSTGKFKEQMKSSIQRNKPVDRNDLQEAAGNASENAHPSGSRDPTDTANIAARDQQYRTNSNVDGQAGAQAGISTLRERASENIPEDTKQQVRETRDKTRDRTKNYVDQKMPRERREQLIYRLKKMVVEIQGHQDYMRAIDTLLDLASEYGGHAQTIGQQGTGTLKDAHGDSALNKAERDIITLLERFTNNTSSEDLVSSINAIYADADRDPELKNWFKEMNTFIRACLKEQGYIMKDSSTEHWNKLYDRGNFLLRDRYRPHTDRIVDEFRFMGQQFDEDPMNRRFAEACQKLFNDLGNDENGKPAFKPHLLKDLSEVIIPAAFENIRYMPIPRLEYRDPEMEFVIENLVIESDNLMPNVFEVANDNYFRWGRKGFANKNSHAVQISVAGMQMDLKDVSYYVNRKTSGKFKDTGILDIFLGGTGLSFKMKLATAEKKDRQNLFKVDKVDVDIKNFNIKIKKSTHKILLTLAKSVLIKSLRPALQKAVEQAIKQKFEEADRFAYKIQTEAERAKQEALKNPENAPNLYRNYVNAVRTELMRGQQKVQQAQQSMQQKEFKMAVTKDDSIFPNISLPGGISSKATEYRQSALSGEDWHSPVFGFGSASRSTDIPSAGKVTKKPHSVTQGGVRGPQNVGNTQPMTSQTIGESSGTTGNGSAGFGQHVDQAFNTNGNTNGGVNGALNGGLNGKTATNGNYTNGHTTLGANNPVLSGRV